MAAVHQTGAGPCVGGLCSKRSSKGVPVDGPWVLSMFAFIPFPRWLSFTHMTASVRSFQRWIQVLAASTRGSSFSNPHFYRSIIMGTRKLVGRCLGCSKDQHFTYLCGTQTLTMPNALNCKSLQGHRETGKLQNVLKSL